MLLFRRVSLALSLMVLVLSSATVTRAAAGQHMFSQASFGYSLKYPAGWQLTFTNTAVDRRMVLTHAGKTQYSLTVLVIPVRPARTIRATLSRVVSFETSRGTGNFGRIKWLSTAIGHRPALGSVTRVATEGGVGLANGMYVAASNTHVYEITIVLYGKGAPSNPDKFPAAYRQILGTWRYR